MGFAPVRMPENDFPWAMGWSKASFVARLRLTRQALPSRVIFPPALAGKRKF